MALETAMTVREIDRRVLLVHVTVGLITCVWGRIGQAARHPTPASGSAQGYCLLPQNEVEVAEV